MSVALLSYFINLKAAFGLFSVIVLLGVTIGMYRFAKIWIKEQDASFAAIYIVLSSCIVETLHIFGQVPTLTGLCFLLNALPDIYNWLRSGKIRYALMSISMMGVVSAAHHVTTIFGIVFFIAPVCGLAFLDVARETEAYPTWKEYFLTLKRLIPRLIVLGGGMLTLLIVIIFPYWYNSKTDPITQISIPHGSRDSFFEYPNSGFVFFLIPLGLSLWLFPYIVKRLLNRRNFFLGISFLLMVLLGTGGTTPIPKILLGANAFNILTLDRFSFWASIIGCVFIGEYLAKTKHKIIWAIPILAIAIGVANISKFRPMQPKSIDMQPIVSFLNQDQHERWRYLTLGFGDQMAWLSTQSNALSVDGNYHSARRLPELTVRAVERLENAKYKGVEGIGALQQFLFDAEKYHLKFIFSNDKFYDPLLYFAGWERVQRLENGIVLWQKTDVSPIPAYTLTKKFPQYQVLMWGILPILMLCIALSIQSYFRFLSPIKKDFSPLIVEMNISTRFRFFYYTWVAIICLSSIWGLKNVLFERKQDTPQATLKHYYDALDFKYFDIAHSYFDPNVPLSLAQYQLNRSLEDGIVASYAKLNGIFPTIEMLNDSIALAKVKTEWITPLENYHTFYKHKLIKRDGKWYIIPEQEQLAPPEDVLIQKNRAIYHNVGRRENILEQTNHEDILDRPELQILQARLVQNDTLISVVGELQNIDASPAYITVEADIFTDKSFKIAHTTAGFCMKHKILPKEKTIFRADFVLPKDFNISDIQYFTIEARAVVTDFDLNKEAVLENVSVYKNDIKGVFYNNGIEEMTVPQILFAYYDSQKKLIWVQDRYLREGLKPAQKRNFDLPILATKDICVLNEGEPAQFRVNGMQQHYFLPIKRQNDMTNAANFLVLQHGFCLLEPNVYVGNSSIY